ncbi:MAG: GNAT family N-acetyltransferase [Oligoflexales bacterium]|nr:GNAT family N-acetyltransferase [Oligoflexales bacterium]
MTSKGPYKQLFFSSSLFLLAIFLSHAALALPFIYKDKGGGQLIADDLKTTCQRVPTVVPTARTLMLSSFLEAYQRLPELKALRTVQVWRGFLEEACTKDLEDVTTGTSHGLILRNREGLQGVSIFRKEGPVKLYLSSFTINAEHKRRGFGRCLLCATIESTREQDQDLEQVHLVTRSANHDAVVFYQSMGFRPSAYMHEGYSAPDYTGMTLEGEELHQLLESCATLRVQSTEAE